MNKPYYEKPHGNYFVGDICKGHFPIHIHDVVEIVYMLEGNMIINLDGEERMLLPGDCAIAFPEVVHGYEQASENAEGICIAFLPSVLHVFDSVLRNMKPVSPVIRIPEEDEEIQSVIGRLKNLIGQDNEQMILAYIHVFAACLFQRMELIPVDKTVEKGLIFDVLQYISQNYKENLSLESTAHALGISTSHLSHLFSQQLHINFRKYLNVIRIEHACLLLQDSHNTIAEIADACGYECTRTFHRAFLEENNMKPGEYRHRVAKGWHIAEHSHIEEEME